MIFYKSYEYIVIFISFIKIQQTSNISKANVSKTGNIIVIKFAERFSEINLKF